MVGWIMKSQDIGLLLKLVCLQRREEGLAEKHSHAQWRDWDWEPDLIELSYGYEQDSWRDPHKSESDYLVERYSVRALAEETGISKSQVSLALQRCYDVGLVVQDREFGVPRANIKALYELIVYSVRYVFPVKMEAVTRGIATSFAAPVLAGKLMSAGELVPVWPDARGNTKGQSVEPLFKSATHAVRKDPELYALLALIDSIRLGQARERNIATELLAKRLGVSNE